MPDLSIVIVNYNTREPLRRCLESIQARSGDLEVEIVVVDNASKDGSAEMVRQIAPKAIVIEPGHNTWFTGGNNLGMKVASGDYLLFLNPDTVVQPGMLPQLVGYLSGHPDVGAATCQMRFPNGGLQYTCSRVPGYLDLLLGYTFLGVVFPFWRDKRRRVMWYDGWHRNETRAIEIAPGSCIMASLKVIHQINGFDESLRLYFTDDDLCRRILATGKQIHFVSDAILHHEEHASTIQVQRLAQQIYFDDLLQYSRKYYGTAATLFLRALITPTRWAMDWVQRRRGERAAL